MITQKLSVLDTERAILFLKRHFEDHLAEELGLHRVSSPLFVPRDSGIQDNLSGIERPVSFKVLDVPGITCEIVHSLAKWKRMALAQYGIEAGQGIYTDMNALRPDEENLRSGIHSIYVDQWDWEKVILPRERTLSYLKETVRSIYKVMKMTEEEIFGEFRVKPELPAEIRFIHSEELLERYPGKSSKERENLVCREYGAVFLIGIGGRLSDGSAHDGRAPDYDDWTTVAEDGRAGLNGDILVWNPVLERAFELSSMGIRVDREALLRQLEISRAEDRKALPWHRMLLDGKLPLSVGGGIGQSRLSMLLLCRRHIGEVQVSVWPKDVEEQCAQQEISLL